ncbi:ABC transporter substrate-binding protein [Rhodospirillum rubrum]|uniref:ABC transporter substrate-binding protein n=1 Tax=Rhodospirillum rubrum TaxID=1085 RepID=UPI001F5C0A7E|nr:ABC transporter substrate-binding protein [Rhodospirillum rubrum]
MLLGVISLLACVNAALALGQSESPQQDAPLHLRLKWKHQFQFAGYYAALEKGFYAGEGLNVILDEASDSEDAVTAVLAGKAQYGIDSTELLVAYGRGEPVVALAAIFQHSPEVLLARTDSGIALLHDLVGRRVSLPPSSLSLLAYLAAEGIRADQMTIVRHPFSPDPLAQGEVDAIGAYSSDEPYLLRRQGIDFLMFSPRSAGIDFYGDILFTTAEELRARPDRVRAFRRATLQGWEYALSHPQEIAKLIVERYPVHHTLDHLLFEAAAMRQLIAADLVEPGYMTRGRWQAIADLYASFGMIARDLDLGPFLYGLAEIDKTPKIPPGVLLISAVIGAFGLVAVFGLVRYRKIKRALTREIGERRVVESGLRQSEARYRMMIEAAPFGVLISSLSTDHILQINARAEDQLQAMRHWVLDKPFAELFIDPADHRRLLDTLNKTGGTANFVALLRTATDGSFWAEIAAAVIDLDRSPAVFTSFNDISQTKTLERELRALAERDSLTGLANRLRVMDALRSEFDRVTRYGGALSVMMLDLDHFKVLNDRHGHVCGDEALRHFAASALATLRTNDLLGRSGGEEFIVLLPGAALGAAKLIGERLRAAVQDTPLSWEGRSVTLSVSIGLATRQIGDTADSLLGRADQALHQAKSNGRNRLETADMPPTGATVIPL